MADQGPTNAGLWHSELMIALLGPVRLLSLDGKDVTPKSRKARAILAMTFRSHGQVTRSRLIDLLWGDRGDDQARGSLRQALYELRDLAAAGFLVVGRESVQAGPRKVSSDFDSLLGSADDGDATAFADQLERVDLPFLGGLDDLDPAFDDWLRDERAAVLAAIQERGRALARQALDSGERAAARRLLDRLERLDPLDEGSAQLAIIAAIEDGDRAGAARRHARLADQLRNELGVSPSPETEALLNAAGGSRRSIVTPASGKPLANASLPPANPRVWPALGFALVLALALVAAAGWWWQGRGAASSQPTVAVLPFEQAGDDPAFVAAGLSDELLNLLGKQSRFRVLGRMSSQQVGKGSDALAMARTLGITHLLDGRVMSADNRMVVIARLTRVSDGTLLWSDRYERNQDDVFAVQGAIARAVSSQLAGDRPAEQPHATSAEVYNRYLAALQLVRERREPVLREAERLLEEAVRMDPTFAPAFAELSQVTMLLAQHPSYYGDTPFAEARERAEGYARRAIQLDPNLGEGYAALAFLTRDDAAAEKLYRKAIALNPQRSEFHRWYAQNLANLGRNDDSLKEYRRAVEIDPLWGLNYDHLGGALWVSGRPDEARTVFARFLSLSTDERAKGLLRFALAKLEGRLADAYRISKALVARYPSERQMRFDFATASAMLGQRDEALKVVGDDPMAKAVLAANWPALDRLARDRGASFFDTSDYWSADDLLVGSGHGATLAATFANDRAAILADNAELNDAARAPTIIALRGAGMTADADRLMAHWQKEIAKLPAARSNHSRRIREQIAYDLQAGQKDRALRALAALIREDPVAPAPVPLFSLRRHPVFASVRDDPRLIAVDERLRRAINDQRRLLALPAIDERQWISDPATVLTQN